MGDKKYWQIAEELRDKKETTPANQTALEAVRDGTHPEFGVALAPLTTEEETQFSRREFLKLFGAGIALATAACTRRPVEKIIPYLNKPEEVTPGVANWYTSTCSECPAGCGVLVKSREGRPIKLEGNPDHPINRGGLCARGQASLLNLYDPDRLKEPVEKNEANGGFTSISWEDAEGRVTTLLQKIQKEGLKLRILSGAITSPSLNHLIRQFVIQFRDAGLTEFEPLTPEEIRNAAQLSYGMEQVPRYRFDRASVIVSLGADFLGTWISPVEFTHQFAKSRKLPSSKMSRLITFDSAPTLTSENADERHAILPGQEILIALALVYELVLANKKSEFAYLGSVLNFLENFGLERVSSETGISQEVLRRLALELWQNRGQGLVIAGSPHTKSETSVGLQIAVNFLNSILGNDGMTIDWQVSPSNQVRGSFAQLQELIDEMHKGEVACLVLAHANPLYWLELHPKLKEAFARVPTIIAITDRIDETAAHAHLVLPTSHWLEAWGDAMPQEGLYSVIQPAIAPLSKTRSLGEILLAWMEGITMPAKGQGPKSSQASWHQYIKQYWRENIYPRYPLVPTFEKFWLDVLESGALDTLAARGIREDNGLNPPRSFQVSALTKISVRHGTTATDFSLSLYATIPAYDGRAANNPWLQELPDPVTKITWENYACIAPQTAEVFQLREGDGVLAKTPSHAQEIPIHIQPGLHPLVIAIPLGFGRKAAGQIGNGLGVNSFGWLQIKDRDLQFSGQKVSIEKTGKKTKLAATQGHHTIDGRPIIQETTLEEWLKNPKGQGPKAENEETVSLPSMWSEHKYEGHRWVMAIDLNSCTGCSACVLGCQAENNIPVVGKNQVSLGREMHWLRIDRYYSGDPTNPDVTHQPMLCQHCENAPCETVCPVLATVHNEEGLNLQVYNRCIGTRYCSNNCPYKVRRFNWYDFENDLRSPMELALNPDVSVRSRGVMEKCTFCTQRIAAAKDLAKDEGRPLKDGDVKTACQQSCPAQAITFGDLNDPQSQVAKLAKDPRGFKVIEFLNTKPQVTYLAKVRNKLEG